MSVLAKYNALRCRAMMSGEVTLDIHEVIIDCLRRFEMKREDIVQQVHDIFYQVFAGTDSSVDSLIDIALAELVESKRIDRIQHGVYALRR